MIKLTLKDGSIREIESAMPASEIIKGIGMGLYKAACCVKVNGEVKDIRTVIDSDCEFEVLTFDSKAGAETFRHTASHLLAQAVKNLYPDAKLARGPATDTGFYYDFEVEKPFAPEDLTKIEAEMKKLAKEGFELERFELPFDEAVKLMEERGEKYKVELIKKHDDRGESLSFYKQGDFIDLCAGPHIMNVSVIKAVKLLSCTGAYWGKAEDGIQMSRIYGTAFPKASMLEAHLKALEEAKLRDHNKLGRELEYFTTVDYIGQGLPILLPKGAKVIQTLQRWIEDEEYKRGYQLTKTPYMAKRDLYKISGHWDHYRDGMFIFGDPDDETKECFALRPMTCPFQYQVFLNKKRSYRDLPMRLGETSTLFRNEDSGEMHGLIRVRQFTISEGHLILRPEQLEEEFRGCLDLAKYCLETIGLAEDVTYRFSQWDPANPNNKYEGTPEQWDEAQSTMKKILDNIGLDYEVGIDEAAFYGPKLDIQIKNVFGKEDTLITIQIDMLLSKKFGMEYVDTDGKMKNPYIIHRTSVGCYERTLALLIEKYAGVLPLWLAPEQVRILPIKPENNEYAKAFAERLSNAGMRVTVDEEDSNIGPKIKKGRNDRIPYLLICGDNEMNDNTFTVRSRKEGELPAMAADELFTKLITEVATKAK
ncbi:threonyl-tRNA synthetase [Ruminococcus sp. YE71]|uniref:threonine--tRNA ligase n=1 Tax=unclassified Ruminococcus TaxID=2608920 RepID=UPI00088CCC70|nr:MULTISPECIES: threonine--tRNA ligase [unclassified Ruminococcus]SDA24204.1 threonyl-tRNA synthetase [Ruminococcus sp. YE78]SFW41580.1 threonyl-tRNA synthetase [Ruminococcus sp. YE71]